MQEEVPYLFEEATIPAYIERCHVHGRCKRCKDAEKRQSRVNWLVLTGGAAMFDLLVREWVDSKSEHRFCSVLAFVYAW